MTANLRVRELRSVSIQWHQDGAIVSSGSKWLAKQCTGRVFDARSEACIHTLPRVGRRLITWRPRYSEEAAVPVSGQSAVEELLEV